MKSTLRYLPTIVILIFLGCSQPQDPEKSKEYYDLAIEEIRNDNFEKATELFKKAIELDSTNYNAKTYYYFFTDDPKFQDSELKAKTDLITFSDSTNMLSNLMSYGELIQEGAPSDKIIEVLRKSISDNPSYFMNYYYLGMELNKDGNYKEAIQQFNRALELEPNHRYSITERAFSKYNLGNQDEACEEWSKPGGGSKKYYDKYCK